MQVMTYTEFRKNLADAIDRVNQDHSPVIITRQNGNNSVLISLEDFNAYQETAYLMASPKNAAMLNRSIMQLEGGKSKVREIIEE